MGLKQILKKNSFLRLTVRQTRSLLSQILYSDHNFKVKTYIKKHGRIPDLNNPQAYSEKMLWSSENYRDDRFVWFADKYLVRKHIKETIEIATKKIKPPIVGVPFLLLCPST